MLQIWLSYQQDGANGYKYTKWYASIVDTSFRNEIAEKIYFEIGPENGIKPALFRLAKKSNLKLNDGNNCQF